MLDPKTILVNSWIKISSYDQTLKLPSLKELNLFLTLILSLELTIFLLECVISFLKWRKRFENILYQILNVSTERQRQICVRCPGKLLTENALPYEARWRWIIALLMGALKVFRSLIIISKHYIYLHSGPYHRLM